MERKQVATILLLGLMLNAGGAMAGVYRVVGPDGKVTYTDAPPAGHNSVELNVPRHVPGQAPVRPAQKGLQREFVVYGTTTCPYCKGLRADLDRRGISYRFIDVDRNAEGRAKMKAMGADGVPFTTAGGKTYSGYSAGGLEAFLKGLGGL